MFGAYSWRRLLDLQNNLLIFLSNRPWHDVTIPEMKAFIGVLIIMGVLKLRDLSCIEWQTLASGHQVFPKSCQRPGLSSSSGFFTSMTVLYKSLLGHTQFCRLFKVKKLLDLVEVNFEKRVQYAPTVHYWWGHEPFKVRLGFKQYWKDRQLSGDQSLGTSSFHQ